MTDVFISYARKTATQAKAAARALEAGGYSVWFDEHLPAHRAYSEVIEEELANAKAVLVIWSADAVNSEWVRSEAGRGRRLKKLVQLKVEKTALPMPFDQIHCADLSGWDGEGEPPRWSGVVSSIAQLVDRQVVAPAAPAPQPQSELRHLTILSCSLMDAGAMARALDPEEWLETARQYQRGVAEIVATFGGYVVQPGDDLVVCFGYPVAQEDAAERAVRAGLMIADSMAALNQQAAVTPGVALSVRLGVHTSTVVVAPDAHGRISIFGDAVEIAARVSACAAPNELVMTPAVDRLISGLFVTRANGSLDLGGEALALRAVVSASPSGGRSRAAGTPFVGRDDETQLLVSRWKRARDGEGQLVLVSGEPGIGKSRLAEEFRDRIKGERHLWIACSGARLFADTTFHAVTQLLDQAFAGSGQETPAQRFEQLNQALRQASIDADEAAPLIAELLSLPVPEAWPVSALSPDQKRKRLLGAVAAWLFAAARQQPLVIVIEDLHWVDPSTLELIQTLAEQGATGNLLLLLTARPEFRSPWPARGHHAQITLSRLSRSETRELVAGVKAHAGLSEDLLDAVVLRADGVPLFAEELTLLMSDGQGGMGPGDIPATLLDSLAARLDRLGSAKAVAQLASVLGREFSYALLQAVSGMPEDAMQRALGQLADAELIYVQGYPPEAVYQFKHALILDAAYAALLKSRRRALHGRAAQAIVQSFPELAQQQPAMVARHWTEAGEVSLAVAAWTQAGQQAASRAAHVEAEGRLQKALELQRSLPAQAAAPAVELSLLIGLAISLAASRGFAAPHLAKTLLEARAICDQLGNAAALFDVLTAICNLQITAAAIDDARETNRRCEAISLATGDPAHLILVGTAAGYILHTQGDLAGARSRLEDVVRLYDAHDGRNLVYGVPQDPLVTSLIVLETVLQAQGDMAQAERIAEQYLQHARGLGRAFDIAWACEWRATNCLATGALDEALKYAEEALHLGETHGYPLFVSTSLLLKGLAVGRLGRHDEGVAMFKAGFADMQRMGAMGPLGAFLGEAAMLFLRGGDVAGALAAVDEAIVLAERSSRASLPRLYFHRAEILAAQPDIDLTEVLEQLDRASAIAQSQGSAFAAEHARRLRQQYERRDKGRPVSEVSEGAQITA